jgi:DNA-binding IclR family transcriptional regulator
MRQNPKSVDLEAESDDTFASVLRAFSILELLADSLDGLPLSEIARDLSINRAIALKLLNSLERAGYVWRSDRAHLYFATYRVSNVSLRQLQNSGLLDQCSALLERLAEKTGELVRLAVVEREERITWVYSVAGRRRALRVDPNFTLQVSLHTHAVGKAWLMTMSNARALELINQNGGFTALTPLSIRSKTVFVKHLEEARTRGFAVTDGENETGVGAIAAPVMAEQLAGAKVCVGAITLAAPTHRLTAESLKAHGPLLVQTANALGKNWPLDKRVGVSGDFHIV